jgi:hypothetical protein
LVGLQRESVEELLEVLVASNSITDLCQAREINKRQIQNIWTVYPQRYRKFADTLVLTRNPEGLLLNFLPDILKIREFLVNV